MVQQELRTLLLLYTKQILKVCIYDVLKDLLKINTIINFIQTFPMTLTSLEPFVPSGSNYEGSKQFFQELGFNIAWDGGDYTGFEKDGCKFILQKYNNKAFAENFMISVGISNADEFWKEVNEKGLQQKFGIRLAAPSNQPYGREVNIIDLAGVCWHFVERVEPV